MPGQSIEECKVDLLEYFGESIKNSKFYNDYATIASYLSDPLNYVNALRKLDKELESLYLDRLEKAYPSYDLSKMNENDYKYLHKTYMANELSKKPKGEWSLDLNEAEQAIIQFKKILTDTLATNERKHGFSIPETNKVDIIVGLPASFNDLLRNKKPFKDLGAGPEHGEFSHRIQWYLITQIGHMENPVTTIYEKLPGWSTKNVAKYTKPARQRSFYMWEFLVDRDGVPTNAAVIPFKTKEQTDFRAPSNVNLWLRDETQSLTYPWLHSCLKRRWDKRNADNIVLYLARKMFKKSYQRVRDIGNSEFEQIQRVLMEGIISRS